MTKALHTQMVIKRVSLREDGSVSFSAETPELSDPELIEFRKLSKTVVNALIEPEIGGSEVLKIDKKVDGRSPSQRLRAVIFVLWKQGGEPEADFEVYYRMKMENIIDWIKGKLE